MTKNCVDYDIVICCIKLTEFENFDYNGAVQVPKPWLLVTLITFLSQTGCLFKGGANSSKYRHTFNLVCLKSLDST